MIQFDIKRACAVTGHRKLNSDVNEKILYDKFLSVIEEYKINVFLVGMAVGFDMLCFEVLESIRKKKDIKIIACVPCKNQSERYLEPQKLKYSKMLKSADDVVILSEEYTPSCMMQRNMFMVDNSTYLLAYLREERGGTFNTVKYAERQGKNIINM